MGKSHLLMLGLIVTGSCLFSACSSDATNGGGSAGQAGDGSISNGDAGAGDTGPVAALNPQAVLVPTAAPTDYTQLLVAGTDYGTASEIVSVTIGTGKIGKSATYMDGDLAAVSSGGLGFALERTNDKVSLLDNGAIVTTFDLKDAGTDTAPVDNKAYVPFLNGNFISILDLDGGKVSRRIDLSEFVDASDKDGQVEGVEGVYDAKKNIAYFLLQRIDLKDYDASFNLQCSTLRGLIIGIDAATDEILDLNGSKAGKGLELQLVNPRSLSLNADGDTAYLLADGCYDGTTKKYRGVEVVDLTAGDSDDVSTIAYADATTNYLAQMIRTTGTEALVQYADSSFMYHWQRLDLSAGADAVQGELDGVPDAVSYDGSDLLGVQVTDKVGAVVRYKIDSGKTTTISDTSWVGKYGTASSTALVQ